MAYLRSVLSGQNVALFLGDAESKRKGRATWVAEVENIPGMHDVKRPIVSTSKTTIQWLEEHPDLGHDARTIKGKVDRLERTESGFRLYWDVKGETHSLDARFVVIATGGMDVQPHIAGSIEPILPFANRGDAIYCIRCDGHQTIGKRLAMIGNSDTQVHIAAMMIERYGHERVDLLSNGVDVDYSEAARELIDGYGMKVHSEPITKVLGDARKEGLEGFELEGGEVVAVDRAIVALGFMPYNQLLQDVGAKLEADGKPAVSEKFESTLR